jgi:hypothetical protein
VIRNEKKQANEQWPAHIQGNNIIEASFYRRLGQQIPLNAEILLSSTAAHRKSDQTQSHNATLQHFMNADLLMRLAFFTMDSNVFSRPADSCLNWA